MLQHVPLAFLNMGPMEMMVVGVVAVLLFGKNLPSGGRSLGKSLAEFKRGMDGIKEEFYGAVNSPTPSRRHTPSVNRFSEIDDRDEATAPRFEPPASAPQDASAST